MKKYYIILVYLVLLVPTLSQGQVFSCVRNISTNPLDPYNFEWQSAFPNDPGSFTNTWFSWYKNSQTLGIHIINQNWERPISFSGNQINMNWPFAMSNDDRIGTNYYLYSGLKEDERDFRWEDGWELLWMNLGYFPNGIKNDRNRIINVHRI